MSFRMRSIFASAFFASFALPVAALAVNCPPGTPAQTTTVRGADIVIRDTTIGILCHAAMVSVSFINPVTGSSTSVRDAELDTGSDFSVVSASVVSGLNLQPSGPTVTLQAGVQGTQTQVTPYIATVQLVTGKQVTVKLLVRSGVTTTILGRDFLANFVLVYDGPNGEVTLK